MTANVRFVAAADMLIGAQSTDDQNAGLPSDQLITRFQGDVSDACEPVGTWKITEVATLLYMSARDQYGP